MFRVIVLDFDGVIADSVHIKTRAFRELFKIYPEIVEEAVKYHLENGGVSRYKKFEYIYRELLKEPMDQKKLDELGKRFTEFVFHEIIKCPFMPGAVEFFEEFSKILPLYIASGTPHQELRDIAKMKHIDKYFKDSFGTPALKSEIIMGILETEGIGKSELLYIGDSKTDYTEALKAGVPFLGFVSDTAEMNPFVEYKVPVVKDFYELKAFLGNR